jgi:hypothetical protein
METPSRFAATLQMRDVAGFLVKRLNAHDVIPVACEQKYLRPVIR